MRWLRVGRGDSRFQGVDVGAQLLRAVAFSRQGGRDQRWRGGKQEQACSEQWQPWHEDLPESVLKKYHKISI
ncbi:hypothetical protein [Xanthomonas sp. WHRI 7945]|nr:hypothetical protein [Xanthomonas campestris pv. campestris]